MIILSCGHRIDNEPYYNVHLKSSDEFGNKAIAYKSVCRRCFDDYNLRNEILDSDKANTWLMDKDNERN